MSQNKDFTHGKAYKIAYKPFNDSSAFDVEYECPFCGCSLWIYHDRIGTGKLPQHKMKWKCKDCGQWFICNKKQITKILGM